MTMNTITTLGLAAALALPAVSLAQGTAAADAKFVAGPGTVNYLQGQVAVNGTTVTANQAGQVRAQVGQLISTGNGKAEIGIAEGVFVRLGPNSVLRMVAEDPANAEVALERGKADVQVLEQLHRTGEIVIDAKGEGLQLLKPGVYAVDANLGTAKVFDGEADLLPADNNKKDTLVKSGHEVALNAFGTKPHEFDRASAEDDLYRWGMNQGGALAERGGGYEGYTPRVGFAGYGDSYAYGDGFYPGYYGGFYPGFYAPFGFYGGFGYGGFGYRGFGGYGGGFRGGFRR